MSLVSLCKTILFLFVFCAVTAIASPAQTFTSLVSFAVSNGATPYEVALVQGTDGNLWGTTQYGGANNEGTVFKMTPTGTLTTVYSFCAQTNCSDGSRPLAGLMLGTDGNLYGTTGYGGSSGNCFGGCGTVFKITPAGTLTTLHSFTYDDGAFSNAPPVQATSGAFYGTTFQGGLYGYGTLYKITSRGTFTLLYSFNGTDGEYPVSPLTQASNGNLYGTTKEGGANGDGTVFEITAGGKLITLHSFDLTDGAYPVGGLVQATNGNFYGTTEGGGAFASAPFSR